MIVHFLLVSINRTIRLDNLSCLLSYEVLRLFLVEQGAEFLIILGATLDCLVADKSDAVSRYASDHWPRALGFGVYGIF